jgi:hypothetical protein
MPIGIIRKAYDRIEPKVSPVLENIVRHPLYLKATGKTFELAYRALLLRKSLVSRIFNLAQLPDREQQQQMLYMLQKMQSETQDVKEEVEDLKKLVRKVADEEKK